VPLLQADKVERILTRRFRFHRTSWNVGFRVCGGENILLDRVQKPCAELLRLKHGKTPPIKHVIRKPRDRFPHDDAASRHAVGKIFHVVPQRGGGIGAESIRDRFGAFPRMLIPAIHRKRGTGFERGDCSVRRQNNRNIRHTVSPSARRH
jgi:hypothetical protein